MLTYIKAENTYTGQKRGNNLVDLPWFSRICTQPVKQLSKSRTWQEQNWPSFAVTILFPRLLNAADLDAGATILSSVTPQRAAGYNQK